MVIGQFHPDRSDFVGRFIFGKRREEFADLFTEIFRLHLTVGGKALAALGSSGYDIPARARQIRDDLREQADDVQKDLESRFPDEKTRPKLKKGCARGIHFAPLNVLKRRFVTVDATDMARLLGLPSSGPFIAQAVRETLIPNVKKIFGEKMAHHPDEATRSGEAWYLTGTFDTDGYSGM